MYSLQELDSCEIAQGMNWSEASKCTQLNNRSTLQVGKIWEGEQWAHGTWEQCEELGDSGHRMWTDEL